MTVFQRTGANNAGFRSLVALLDADLAARDGEEHAFYSQFNSITTLQHAVVCYVDGKAVGCGALRPFDASSVEIKRMYVLPAWRNHGIARNILKELELWALELGFASCVLETGKKQPEAISLYERAGYQRIKSYGQYINVENSICMKRNIL